MSPLCAHSIVILGHHICAACEACVHTGVRVWLIRGAREPCRPSAFLVIIITQLVLNAEAWAEVLFARLTKTRESNNKIVYVNGEGCQSRQRYKWQRLGTLLISSIAGIFDTRRCSSGKILVRLESWNLHRLDIIIVVAAFLAEKSHVGLSHTPSTIAELVARVHCSNLSLINFILLLITFILIN